MLNEKEFEIIDRIANEHCKKTFGYLEKNDLKNEIWVICLTAITEFDPIKGKLENFLRRTVKTRLINRFKEVTKSVKLPCIRCEFYDKKGIPDCKAFGLEKTLCDKWNNYSLSVESRNSLLNASEPSFEREIEGTSLKLIMSEEIKTHLITRISKKFLGDFNRLVSGGKLSKQRMKKLRREIDGVLNPTEKLVQIKVAGKRCPQQKKTRRKRNTSQEFKKNADLDKIK